MRQSILILICQPFQAGTDELHVLKRSRQRWMRFDVHGCWWRSGLWLGDDKGALRPF